jgi:hypothetical protein
MTAYQIWIGKLKLLAPCKTLPLGTESIVRPIENYTIPLRQRGKLEVRKGRFRQYRLGGIKYQRHTFLTTN